jgi:hypothetical protein
MITVYWTAHIDPTTSTGAEPPSGLPALQNVFFPPEELYSYIREKREESRYLQCYALIDLLKSAYIIKAPLDMTINFTRENNWLSVKGVTQNFYDSFIINRVDQYSKNDPPIVSAPPGYVFYSDVPVEMSLMPLMLVDNPANTRTIPGKFDISKWIRPIDWAFEIVDEHKEIKIKRGDPLFMILFNAPKNEKIVLERVPYTEELRNVIASCVGVKNFMMRVPLQKCYGMAENFLATWRKYRGKL